MTLAPKPLIRPLTAMIEVDMRKFCLLTLIALVIFLPLPASALPPYTNTNQAIEENMTPVALSGGWQVAISTTAADYAGAYANPNINATFKTSIAPTSAIWGNFRWVEVTNDDAAIIVCAAVGPAAATLDCGTAARRSGPIQPKQTVLYQLRGTPQSGGTTGALPTLILDAESGAPNVTLTFYQ